MTITPPTLAAVLELACQLHPSDQLRLIARLSDALANREAVRTLNKDDEGKAQPKFSLYGLLADLGPAPSAEDIDEIRREMWANFPRDDIT